MNESKQSKKQKPRQTKSHVDLIKSIDNFLDVCKDLRTENEQTENNKKKKKTLETKFDKIYFQLWTNFNKYNPDKIKFTYIDNDGELKYA